MAEEKAISLAGRTLMIGVPAYDGKLNIDTAFALANLAVEAGKLGVKLRLTHFSNCSLITTARNGLVSDFLSSDADALLFIDADVIVKADQVLRLFALSLGKDITAGIYPRRGMDRKFFLDYHLDENGALNFDEHGLLRIKRIGTGFMMIQRHVLETMIARHPEWAYYNNVENRTDYAVFDLAIVDGQYFGEDYLFCDRAAKEGFTVYLDPSINLPHIGTAKFERNFEEDVLMPLMDEARRKSLKVANG